MSTGFTRVMKKNGLVAVSLCALVCGCLKERAQRADAMTGGIAEKGRAAIAYHGCGSCHNIPGIPGAIGLIGPSLQEISRRNYLGGVLANSPDNMIRWIENPPGV